MKSYTDLEQSKKLAEILPLESADMTWEQVTNALTKDFTWKSTIGLDKAIVGNLFSYRNGYVLPCWSLAALLDNIPQVKIDSIKQYNKKYWRCCAYFASDWHDSDWYDNPVDACYLMILKIHEEKIL